MRRWSARLVVRLCAWIAPSEVRDRWREEWLAEIRSRAPGSVPRRRRPGTGVLVRTLGAPIDAFVWRLRHLKAERIWSSGWGADLRDVVREWRRAPVRTVITFLCLTIGLAATLATFAFVNAWFAGEIPGVTDRASLGRVQLQRAGFVDDPELHEFQAATAGALESVHLAGTVSERLTGIVDGRPMWLDVQLASPAFFDVLGTSPALGRLLQTADHDPGAPPAAVISHALWVRVFGGVPDVLGRTMTLSRAGSGEPPTVFRVVGVTPRNFGGIEIRNFSRRGPDEGVVWVPMSHASSAMSPDRRNSVVVVGRLIGSSGRASGELARRVPAIAAAAEAAGAAEGWRARGLSLRPFYYAPVSDFADLLGTGALMLAVPLAVLLVVCVNVAALRLAGGVARRHELAIRTSLGASRYRLIRLLVVEAALVAMVAAAAAWIAADAILARAASALPIVVGLDRRVLAVAAMLTGTVTVLAGIWPAARATGGVVTPSLTGGVSRSDVRVYRWLVLVQMALSIGLVASAMLAVRSARNVGDTSRYADIVGPVASAAVTFADPAIGAERRRTLLDEWTSRIAAMPAVEASAVSTMSDFNSGSVGVSVPGQPDAMRRPSQGSKYGVHGGLVSASYFRTFGLATLEGRTFGGDTETDVAVINRALRDRFAPDATAIGTRLRIRLRDQSVTLDATIVGVVEDGIGMAELQEGEARTPAVFLPIGSTAPASVTLFARSSDPAGTARDVAAMLTSASTPLVVERAGAMRDRFEGGSPVLRGLAGVMSAAAGIALIVAAMGLWAVASIGVSRRRREFGVRLAVGAERTSIARMLFVESMRSVAIGGSAGLAVAFTIFMALRSELVGVEPWDPVALGGTVAVLAAAGIAASVGPALRAARVSPLEVIRDE
jgi:predicted permease